MVFLLFALLVEKIEVLKVLERLFYLISGRNTIAYMYMGVMFYLHRSCTKFMVEMKLTTSSSLSVTLSCGQPHELLFEYLHHAS